MIERERRFLVDQLPDDLPDGSTIEQGYLTTEPVAVRVRHRGDQYVLTIKSGSGRNRVEIERDLAAEEFTALWDLAHELRIHKQRIEVPLHDGHTAELDLFAADLEGHRVVEVEFDDDASADAFEPPDWFGREITDDVRYNNASLARHGWPTS